MFYNLHVTWPIYCFVLFLLPVVISFILASLTSDFVRGTSYVKRYFQSFGFIFDVLTGGSGDRHSVCGRIVTIVLRVIGMIFIGYVVWM